AFIDQMAKCGFFKNDSQITDLHIEKFYAEKACIVVEYKEIEA
ncbi:MAG: RusA family crossover junction endodeoxyribonuclease, partial [Lachnospiraceae bacterium]|nr:RusA family crossover junction endodeoxyribonuclease [Lachnospiraceae bacterium]